MKNFFLGSVFVLNILGNNVFAEELKTEITIAPEHQGCQTDADCTTIDTSCLRQDCACPRSPVNKAYYKEYFNLIKECMEKQQTQGALVIACDMVCQEAVKCVANRCQVTVEEDGLNSKEDKWNIKQN